MPRELGNLVNLELLYLLEQAEFRKGGVPVGHNLGALPAGPARRDGGAEVHRGDNWAQLAELHGVGPAPVNLVWQANLELLYLDNNLFSNLENCRPQLAKTCPSSFRGCPCGAIS